MVESQSSNDNGHDSELVEKALSSEETSSVKASSHANGNSKLFAMVLAGLALVLALACFSFWYTCIRMPGESYVVADEVAQKNSPEKAKQLETERSASEESSLVEDSAAKDVVKELKSYVTHLAETIGERNLNRYPQLCEAADYIESKFVEFGFEPKRQTFQVQREDCFNIEAELTGMTEPEKIVIIGAHYDSIVGTPGANDNASGTAAMLVLARHFKDHLPDKTLRFVAFTNEEPPWFHTRDMGSWVYAKKCSEEKQEIVAVLSLETMGYFSDEEDSQRYPAPLHLMYPSTGNFIGFVSNIASRNLQRRVIKVFRQHAEVPSEGASLPDSLPGVGWSDHWSFWQEGYPGIMITDTAPFRYPHYHEPTDTPDQIDYETFAKVLDGLTFVIEDLVSKEE